MKLSTLASKLRPTWAHISRLFGKPSSPPLPAPSLTPQSPYEHLINYLHYCEGVINTAEQRGSDLKQLKGSVRETIKSVKQTCDPLAIHEMFPAHGMKNAHLASEQLCEAHMEILHASPWFCFLQDVPHMDTYEAFLFKWKMAFFHHVICTDEQDPA